jgi:hypothetical protein
MRKIIVAVFFLISVVPSKVVCAEAGKKLEINPIKENERNQIQKNVKQQLDALKARNDSKLQDLVEQARLTFWLGQLESSSDEKLKFFQDGMKLMEPYLDDHKEPGPILLWAANAGGVASIKRNLDALRMLELIEKKLLEVASRFPKFQSGAADRALAEIYLSAPRFVSIGSGKKAVQHANAAFVIDSTHPGNKLIMAKIFSDNGDETKAKVLLEEVLTLAIPETYPLDYVTWRTEALKALDAPKGYSISG